MKSCVVGEFGVERRDEGVALSGHDRDVVVLREHLDRRTEGLDARCPDEHGVERFVEYRYVEVRLETVDLPAIGVSLDHDVDGAEGGEGGVGDLLGGLGTGDVAGEVGGASAGGGDEGGGLGGGGGVDYLEIALKLGAQRVFPKPFSLNAIVAAVDELLGGTRLGKPGSTA